MTKRNKFFNKKHEFITLGQILEFTGSKLLKDEDKLRKIYDVATLDRGDEKQISFLNSGAYFQKLLVSKVGFCFIDEASAVKAFGHQAIFLINKNPYFAYSQIASHFYEEKPIELSAKNIHESAKIGEGSVIAPSAYVGADVEIGKNCRVDPNAVVLDGCVIGDGTQINSSAVVSFCEIGKNCKIYPGAKIGQDGFGFAHNKGVNHKIIQLGTVEIGDDVEIGANSCVDRGAIENTKIANGVKIDNLVQIGHNVSIDVGTVIAGCTAIAGSAKIGKFVQIGGNSSIAGHLEVKDGVRIAGMSGIGQDVEAMSVVGGIPAIPLRQWHRLNFKLMKMLEKKED